MLRLCDLRVRCGAVQGPGYGDFAITHHVAALRGLETTLGTSVASLNVSGLAEVPRYYIDIGSNGFTPSGATFNWADGGTGQGSWLPVALAGRYAESLHPGAEGKTPLLSHFYI
jgi:hypothetical protein